MFTLSRGLQHFGVFQLASIFPVFIARPFRVTHPDPLLAAAGLIFRAVDTVQPPGTWARADIADRASNKAADLQDILIIPASNGFICPITTIVFLDIFTVSTGH